MNIIKRIMTYFAMPCIVIATLCIFNPVQAQNCNCIADNGLTNVMPNDIHLGGNLIKDTSIDLDGFRLSFPHTTGSGGGQIVMGRTAPINLNRLTIFQEQPGRRFGMTLATKTNDGRRSMRLFIARNAGVIDAVQDTTNLILRTNGMNRIFIMRQDAGFNAGYVGVGSGFVGGTNPQEMLHVEEFIRSNELAGIISPPPTITNTDGLIVADNDGTLATKINFSGNAGEFLTGAGTWVAHGGADSDWSGAASGQMFTTSLTDNVGIGTATPNAKLEILHDNGTPDKGLLLRGAASNSGSPRITSIWTGGSGSVIDAQGVESGWGLLFYVNSLEKMRIRDDGNVGIDQTNPQERLHVIGNILASGSITSGSDRRFKQQINTLQNALEKVKQLRGTEYFMNTADFPDHKFSDAKQIGFIAQEVEEVFPELVITHSDGYKSVDYMKVTPILVEAIKSQQGIIAEQQLDINDQQQQLDRLQNDNDRIQKDNEEIRFELDQMVACLQQLGLPVGQMGCQTEQNINSETINSGQTGSDPVNQPENSQLLLSEDTKGNRLAQNTPNPFRQSTTISYSIARTGQVNLTVFDHSGRQVALLVNEKQTAGDHKVDWTTSDMPAGVYLYVLNLDGSELIRKAIHLR